MKVEFGFVGINGVIGMMRQMQGGKDFEKYLIAQVPESDHKTWCLNHCQNIKYDQVNSNPIGFTFYGFIYDEVDIIEYKLRFADIKPLT